MLILGQKDRLMTGHTLAEVRDRAATWWDRRGRHVVKNPEFRNPDIGFPSGITRGLPWENLTGDERIKVAREFYANYLVKDPLIPDGKAA